ncbi:unnamed protein product [Symbiodinium natans]|uniref:Uncharacterized protein n=1 Tax=Symbiodinium natans TaxID=878477 RepID=A0A812LDM0_9DINO|nr:unnamed protein product [Symbiodinium natans]
MRPEVERILARSWPLAFLPPGKAAKLPGAEGYRPFSMDLRKVRRSCLVYLVTLGADWRALNRRKPFTLYSTKEPDLSLNCAFSEAGLLQLSLSSQVLALLTRLSCGPQL